MSKRYFINNLDTRIGRSLLGQLVKQPTEEPSHMCTMRNQSVTKPNGIKKILKRAKPKLSKKKMLEECDVYVYSLEDTDLNDIKFALNSLEKGAEEQKVLVLVSDVRVWSDSGKKKVLKVVKEEENNEEGEEGEKGSQEAVEDNKQKQSAKEPSQKSNEEQGEDNQQNNEEEEQKEEKEQEDPYQYVSFRQQDYLERKPLSQYQYIKQAEDLILNFKRQNVKVIVICPGILFGQGQHIFQSLFKAAWLQNPKALPYLGEGTNILPTIHIADLAKFIIKLAESPPEQKIYFNAFDLTKDRSQKALIESISKGVGSGLVESVEKSEIINDPDTFKLDIQVQTSKQLVGSQEQPVQFEWTSKYGLYQSIKNVLNQFCQQHNLRPLKILSYVSEADANESNYSTILTDLKNQYRIPILRSEQILKYALEHLDGDFKLDLEDEYQGIVEYLNDKKSRPLDQTLKVYYRVMKWRLLQNDCATRGYILDGEPHFEQQFKHIFLPLRPSVLRRKIKRAKPEVPKESPRKSQQQNNQEQNQKNEQQKPIEEEQLKEPEEQLQEQDPQDDEDRPKKQVFYPQSVIVIKNLNIQKHQSFEVVEYLSLNGTQQLLYNSIGKPQLVVSQSLRSYIERNGRPNNYLIHQDLLKEKHQTYYRQLNNTLKEQKTQDQAKDQAVIDSQKQHRQDIAQQVYKMIQGEGEFEIKKMPFRNYLMQFVVPTLNESLLEVSNIIPNDPVELLAEYLYQRSYES